MATTAADATDGHAIAATRIYDLIYTSYCFAAEYRAATSLQFAMSQMALT